MAGVSTERKHLRIFHHNFQHILLETDSFKDNVHKSFPCPVAKYKTKPWSSGSLTQKMKWKNYDCSAGLLNLKNQILSLHVGPKVLYKWREHSLEMWLIIFLTWCIISSLDVTLRKNVALQHFTLYIQFFFKSLCFLKLIFELYSALVSWENNCVLEQEAAQVTV